MKQSKLLYSGPASMQSNIPELPDSGPQSMSFMLLDALGNAAPSTMKVSLFDSKSKEQIWSSAFNDGESGCFEPPESENFHAIIGNDKWTSLFLITMSMILRMRLMMTWISMNMARNMMVN